MNAAEQALRSLEARGFAAECGAIRDEIAGLEDAIGSLVVQGCPRVRVPLDPHGDLCFYCGEPGHRPHLADCQFARARALLRDRVHRP